VKTRRHSEARIFQILKEVEAGCPVVDAAREHGVSPATIHRWKSKYGGMTLSELEALKSARGGKCQAEADSGSAGTGQRAT